MKKFCIFCGNKPDAKTNEHVIPKWLIELTGHPKRVVTLGFEYKEEGLPLRRFAFDQFRFPACTACNKNFAQLEGLAKPVVLNILSKDRITAPEFSILLDWFDKIRIGLWLAFHYLDKNIAGITPRFHIQKGLRANDRLLLICRSDCKREGLTFVGCNTPSFYHTPSCFSLIINSFYFLNMSYEFLIARRIGLPYSIEEFVNPEDESSNMLLAKGRERVMKPLLRKVMRPDGCELYQPMFPLQVSDSETRNLYDTEYVRSCSMDWPQGVGKIYKQERGTLREYSMQPSLEWIPTTAYEIDALNKEFTVETLGWQNYITDMLPSLDLLQSDRKKFLRRKFRQLRNINTKLIKMYRESRKRKAD